MTSTLKPDSHVRESLIQAIEMSLKEEQIPRRWSWIRAFGGATLLSAILTAPILFLFGDTLTWIWLGSGLLWWILLFGGLVLYFQPHPRLQVPGYYSPTVFSLILVVMSLANALQILVCPDLVFLESPSGWAPFAPITHALMHWGGMTACMIFCGLTFTFISSVGAFFFIRKTLSWGGSRDFLHVAGLAAVSQLPLFWAQVLRSEVRIYIFPWIVGLGMGLGLSLILVRGFRLRFAKEAR